MHCMAIKLVSADDVFSLECVVHAIILMTVSFTNKDADGCLSGF